MKRLLRLLPLAWLAACNSEIELQSNRSPSYEGNPRRILVAAVNQLYPSPSPDEVVPTLVERLGRCGITAEAAQSAPPPDPLPLDDKPSPSEDRQRQLAGQVAAFRPDAVLLVRSVALSVSQRQTLSGIRSASLDAVRYDVQLLDVASNRLAYRAAVNLRIAPTPLQSPPRAFARLLVDRLAEDSIVQGCPPPTRAP